MTLRRNQPCPYLDFRQDLEVSSIQNSEKIHFLLKALNLWYFMMEDLANIELGRLEDQSTYTELSMWLGSRNSGS